MWVRFPLKALKQQKTPESIQEFFVVLKRLRPRTLDEASEARLLARGGVGLNNARLASLVDSRIRCREEALCLLYVLSCYCLGKRLGSAVYRILAAQVIDVLFSRRADCLFC